MHVRGHVRVLGLWKVWVFFKRLRVMYLQKEDYGFRLGFKDIDYDGFFKQI